VTDLNARLDTIELTAKFARLNMSTALIASHHLLNVPFTDRPELSPWTRSIRPALDYVRQSAGEHVPALVAALRAVLDLHKPEGTNLHWCENDGIAWPCPTYTAVAAALEES
jgi:hypothetical protein